MRNQSFELYLLKCAHFFSVDNSILENSSFFKSTLALYGLKNLDDIDLSEGCTSDRKISYDRNLESFIHRIRNCLCKTVDPERNEQLKALFKQLHTADLILTNEQEEAINLMFLGRTADEGLDAMFALLLYGFYLDSRFAPFALVAHTTAVLSAISYLLDPKKNQLPDAELLSDSKMRHPRLPLSLNLLADIYDMQHNLFCTKYSQYISDDITSGEVSFHQSKHEAFKNCKALSLEGTKAIDAATIVLFTKRQKEYLQWKKSQSQPEPGQSKKEQIEKEIRSQRMTVHFGYVCICVSSVLLASAIFLACGDAGMLKSPILARAPLLKLALENSYSSLSSHTSAHALLACQSVCAIAGSAAILFSSREHLKKTIGCYFANNAQDVGPNEK